MHIPFDRLGHWKQQGTPDHYSTEKATAKIEIEASSN